VFFVVGLKSTDTAEKETLREEFVRLSKAHEGSFGPCDPFDDDEHGWEELGGWLGDQMLGLMYMGLGVILGEFMLMTPKAIPGMPEATALKMAMGGLLKVKKAKKAPAVVQQSA
jgi:hypothetical protein